jgi:fimbrial chaperone protein
VEGVMERRRGFRRRLLAPWPLLLFAWAGLASAQAISASPLRADLSAAEPVAVVTLRNDDPRFPTIVQARPSAWSVVDSEDRYEPTRELVVSPTVFKLEPGQTQVIRVSLRGRPDVRVERLYRLFLQQLPDEAEQSRRTGNVRFLFTFAIPVVVAPTGDPNPVARVAWRIERGSAGEYRLRASNEGTAHVKIAGVSLPASAGDLRVVSAATYLLPGTERAWSFKTPAPLPPGPVDLTILANDGTSSVVQASAAE